MTDTARERDRLLDYISLLHLVIKDATDQLDFYDRRDPTLLPFTVDLRSRLTIPHKEVNPQ